MTATAYLYHPAFLAHETPSGHPERPERLTAINDKLRRSGLWERLDHPEPRPAKRENLISVHDADFVDRILSLDPPAYLDGGDTYFSAGTKEAALLAAGAGLTAVDEVVEGRVRRAFCAVRPPGHHAEAAQAMGFCVFNNIAVTARYAQSRGFGKVFIIDFDVHHGNGTEHLFADDPSVFYFSSHQYPHYPGTGASGDTGRGAGAGFTRNLPMAAGSGDPQYTEAYETDLPPVMENFNPDLLLVSAGYDIHTRDPLSYINVSTEGIRGMVETILRQAGDRPVLFFLEGGYDLDGLSDAVCRTVEALLESPEVSVAKPRSS